MKKLVMFLFMYQLILAQSVTISLNSTSIKSSVLYALEGEKKIELDTMQITNNTFKFILQSKIFRFYNLLLDNQESITFVYNGNDIELKADAEDIPESLEVVTSESNKIYYDFIKLNKQYKTKTELLLLILARYPNDDSYYQTTVDKVEQLQNEYTNFVDSVVSIDSLSFTSSYVKSSQLPIVDYTLPVEEQLAYLKSHALDKVDFNDAELIYSDCFTNKSIEYLTYYQNPQLPKQLLEQEFQKAVDTLLTKASVNILVYQHIADYLIDGFKQFGFDNIVDYIVGNYVVKDDLCLDEQTENSIENRINQSKLLKVGTDAPNIILPDTAGNEINVSKIEKEKVLLLFYASWCPHCKEMLPEIYELYKQRNDLEVVAISLDETKEEWTSFITNNNLDWINISDLKGWGSQAAKDYYIYATPTMFLLDDNMHIIAKPINYNELTNILNR